MFALRNTGMPNFVLSFISFYHQGVNIDSPSRFFHHVQQISSQINIRALHAQRDLIDRAAVILKKSRFDFMLNASCNEAKNVLLDQRLFILNNSVSSFTIKQVYCFIVRSGW